MNRGWGLKWPVSITILSLAKTPATGPGTCNSWWMDAKASRIHNVYIAMSMSDGASVKKLVRDLADTTCSVILIPDVFTFNILHSRIEEMNGCSGGAAV